MHVDRREFLKKSGFVAAGFMGLKNLMHAAPGSAAGASGSPAGPMKTIAGYGPLVPDPAKIFDLPEGFTYSVISRAGDEMDDGLLVPGDADGMAAFPGPDGRILLVRNHELNPGDRAKSGFGPNHERLGRIAPEKLYDAGSSEGPMFGGTTNIVYNPKTMQAERVYTSLAGTENNCAGGPTPWGSWVTCEETTTPKSQFWKRDHGYNFEVPADADGTVDPVPLKAMGRFRHEAIAVDPKSGIVYQTEDMGDGLIYRFIPKTKGKLAEGGTLQALMVEGQPSRDTRNWKDTGEPTFPAQAFFNTRWVDLRDVEAPRDDLRFRGFRAGAARFARGEGMWYGNGEVYWACTNGGPIGAGQIFRYIPSPYEGQQREKDIPGRLELFLESTDRDVLKNADNLCIAPWGDVIIAEDSDQPCRLVGVTPEGAAYTFAANSYNGSELAGCCFSPDGQTLFVNIQKTGLTLAVTGPWSNGVPA
ncbi:MAG: alkaline phosphatase PhoX [Opitutales bacterium]